MCGESNRPTFGGTIAVLFPPENRLTLSASERSLSSSPDSVASSTSSISHSSSYSLFFRDSEKDGSNKTRAIFQFDDNETYKALRGCQYVDMRIESVFQASRFDDYMLTGFNRKFGDLSTTTPNAAPLHKFRLDFARSSAMRSGHHQAGMELELPEMLDLGVSAKGVVGRQVTMSDENGIVIGVGIVGYN